MTEASKETKGKNKMDQGGYYAVIPATILYDKELSANEKMLYAIISQLAIKTGFCYASNSYLAETLGVSIRAVSKWINKLIQKEYLDYKYEYEPGTKEIKERHLFIGIERGFHTYRTTVPEGIEPRCQDNNIKEQDNVSYGIVNEDRTPSFEEVQAICKSLDSEEYAEEVFNDLTKQNFKDKDGKPIANLKAFIDQMIQNKKYNESKKKEKEQKKAYNRKNNNKVPNFTIKRNPEPQPEEEKLNLDEVIKETLRQHEEKMKRTNQEQSETIIPYEEDIPDLSIDPLFE